MANEILSPITGSESTELLREIDSSEIVGAYLKKFEYNTDYIFQGIEKIREYKCRDTGYRFFFPFSAAGDDRFYRHFAKYDWYYLPWKWEHEKATEYITDGINILEVGAARGNFLEVIQKRFTVSATGLELNSDAVAEAASKGVRLLHETIEEHARSHPAEYDVVCSFQVLEHIPNAGEVIRAMSDCLRPGGRLIISVPNNESYLKDNPLPSRILNMPPHHMGLWSPSSLKNLEKFFPIRLMESFIEPLQDVHSDTYQYVLIKKFFFNSTFFTRIYWKLRLHLLMRRMLKTFSHSITGHSIMVIFEKNG